MNIKLFTTLFFVVYGYVSHAESHVRKYFDAVNKAELSLVKDGYEEALKIYQEAFKMMDPFASDVSNAFECAMIEKDTVLAIKFCRMLAEKGVGPRFFDKKCFSGLAGCHQWPQIISLATKVKQRFLKKNLLLERKLSFLQQKDRESAIKFRSLIDTLDFYNWKAQIDFADSLAIVLNRIFKNHGVVNERRLGVAIADDTSLVPNYTYDVMVLHCFQKASVSNRIDLSSQIIAALNKGLISPVSLRVLFKMSPAFDTRLDETRLFVRSKKVLYRTKFRLDDEWMINRMRNAFFMCSLSDLEKKVIAQSRLAAKGIYIGCEAQELKEEFRNEDERTFFESQFIKVANLSDEGK